MQFLYLTRTVALLLLLFGLIGEATAQAVPPHFLPCHHDPPLEAEAGHDLVLDFILPDYAVVRTGLLYLRFSGEREYVVIPLVQEEGELYSATVPADQLRGTFLEYYVMLLDRAGRQHNSFAGPDTPRRVPIVGVAGGELVSGPAAGGFVGVGPAEDPPDDQDDLAEVFAVFGGADMVVSASKREQKIGEAPAAVYVLTAEELRYTGTPSIAEALRMAPGAEVFHISPSNVALGMRGLTSEINDLVLVLIDGREVNLDLFGATFWEMLPISIEEIERVEVIRGPASTLHGANAYSGVVNIITREQQTDGLSTTASIRGGSTGSMVAHGAVYGKQDWFRYTATAGYDSHDAWWNSDYDSKDVIRGRIRASFEPMEDMDLSFEGGLTSISPSAGMRDKDAEAALRDKYRRARSDEERAQINADYRTLVHDQFRGGAKIYTGISEVGIEGTQSYTMASFAWAGLNVRAYWNRLDAELAFISLGELALDLTDFVGVPFVAGEIRFPERIEGSGDTFDLEIQYTTPEDLIPYNILTVGGNGRLVTFEGTNLTPMESTEQRAGIFIQDELKIWDWLVITAGLRLDFNDVTPDTVDGVSPMANVSVNPYGDHFLRVGFASAYRKPSFLEAKLHLKVKYEEYQAIGRLAENLETLFQEGIGNPALDNETVYSMEFGYLGHVWEKRIRMNLDFFYSWYRDFIGFAFDIDAFDVAGLDTNADEMSSFVQFRNEGNNATAYGVELGIDARLLDWLYLWGNFSWLHLEGENEVDVEGNPLPAREQQQYQNPEVTFNLGGRLVFDFGLNAAVWVNFMSEYCKPLRSPDGFFSFEPGAESSITQCMGNDMMLNTRVGWRFWDERLEVGLEGWNLLAPLMDYPRQFPGQTEIVDLDLGPGVNKKQIGNFGGERMNLRLMGFVRLDY